MAAPKATTLNSQYVTAFSVHEPAKISPTHRVKSPLSLRTVLLPGRQVLRSQDHPWRLLSRLLCLFLFLLSGRQCSSISLHLYQSLRWERLGFSGCQHPFLPHLLEAQVSLPSWLWTPHCHIMSWLCATGGARSQRFPHCLVHLCQRFLCRLVQFCQRFFSLRRVCPGVCGCHAATYSTTSSTTRPALRTNNASTEPRLARPAPRWSLAMPHRR